MDDGTAGEMVASYNYWEAISASTRETDSVGLAEQSASKREKDDETIARKQGRGGDGSDGGCHGDGLSVAAGRTLATLGGMEWAAVHLDSGNVKVEASASAAEASSVWVRNHWHERARKLPFRCSACSFGIGLPSSCTAESEFEGSPPNTPAAKQSTCVAR